MSTALAKGSDPKIFTNKGQIALNFIKRVKTVNSAALAHGIGRIYAFFYLERKLFFFWIVDRKDATLSGVVDTKFSVYSI